MSVIDSFPPEWRPVIETACASRGMGVLNLVRPGRQPRVVRRRHAVWLEIHDRFGATPTEIGRRFGFHRTTVLHGLKRARDRAAK